MPGRRRLSLGRPSLVPETVDNRNENGENENGHEDENMTPKNTNIAFFNDDSTEKRKSREKVKRRRSLRRRSLRPSPRKNKKGKKKKDPAQLKALYSAIIKVCTFTTVFFLPGFFFEALDGLSMICK